MYSALSSKTKEFQQLLEELRKSSYSDSKPQGSDSPILVEADSVKSKSKNNDNSGKNSPKIEQNSNSIYLKQSKASSKDLGFENERQRTEFDYQFKNYVIETVRLLARYSQLYMLFTKSSNVDEVSK